MVSPAQRSTGTTAGRYQQGNNRRIESGRQIGRESTGNVGTTTTIIRRESIIAATHTGPGAKVMSLFLRLLAAFRPEHHRPVVVANEEVRTQISRLKDEAEETIKMIDEHTGIWHQDMLEGVYRGEQRPRVYKGD
jgi:hypothetical protein